MYDNSYGRQLAMENYRQNMNAINYYQSSSQSVNFPQVLTTEAEKNIGAGLGSVNPVSKTNKYDGYNPSVISFSPQNIYNEDTLENQRYLGKTQKKDMYNNYERKLNEKVEKSVGGFVAGTKDDLGGVDGLQKYYETDGIKSTLKKKKDKPISKIGKINKDAILNKEWSSRGLGKKKCGTGFFDYLVNKNVKTGRGKIATLGQGKIATLGGATKQEVNKYDNTLKYYLR